MIYFITGKPRHGKGLYSLTTIEKRAKAENRQVYYMGIDGLKLDWKQLDKVEDWVNLPYGAIIVFDECHKFFPQEKIGSTLPYHVEFLAEHAHNGYDMYFITQSPKRISTFLRDRVEEHHHVVRVWGKERANVYKFFDIQSVPLSAKAKEDGIKTPFIYPKHLYGMYNSSNMHNVKASVPFRYYLLFILPLLVLALAYKGITGLKDAAMTTEETPVEESPLLEQFTPKSSFTGSPEPVYDYFEARVERLQGLPHTQPLYDEITKPVEAPVPAACVDFKGECRCYSQQGTLLMTPPELCRQIVQKGYFVDFENGDALQTKQRQNNPQSPPPERVASVAPERGETVAPAAVAVPAPAAAEQPEVRSPSKITRERMQQSPWAFKG